MKILLVVSRPFTSIGGHILSSMTLAKALANRGHQVGLLVSQSAHKMPELEDVPYSIHYTTDSVEPKFLSSFFHDIPNIFTFLRDIPRYTKKNAYKVIVAMDWWAGVLAFPTVMKHALPLIQVQPGGPLVPIPRLRLPGIIVFSEELFNGISVKQKIPREYLILSSGRVDFEYFRLRSKEESECKLFDQSKSTLKLLLVSRFDRDKAQAIKFAVDEVCNAAQHLNLQFTLIGDGERAQILRDYAAQALGACSGCADVKFMGSFRVCPSDLVQADLVIGQGRSVIEAMASGVPAAICGEEGYKGLLTRSRLSLLAKSNLTGRGITTDASLIEDLLRLEEYRAHEHEFMWQMAYDLYDVNRGADAIEQAIALSNTVYPKSSVRRCGYLWAFLWIIWKILSARNWFVWIQRRLHRV